VVTDTPCLCLLQVLPVMIFVSIDKNTVGYTDLVCSSAAGETAPHGSVVVCGRAREAVLARCMSVLPAGDSKPWR